MIDDRFTLVGGHDGELVFQAREEFGVVLDFYGLPGFGPISAHGADAVGADAEDLRYFVGAQVLDTFFGELGEEEVIA